MELPPELSENVLSRLDSTTLSYFCSQNVHLRQLCQSPNIWLNNLNYRFGTDYSVTDITKIFIKLWERGTISQVPIMLITTEPKNNPTENELEDGSENESEDESLSQVSHSDTIILYPYTKIRSIVFYIRKLLGYWPQISMETVVDPDSQIYENRYGGYGKTIQTSIHKFSNDYNFIPMLLEPENLTRRSTIVDWLDQDLSDLLVYGLGDKMELIVRKVVLSPKSQQILETLYHSYM